MDTRLAVVALFCGGVLALPLGLFVAVFSGAPAFGVSVGVGLFLPFAVYAVSVAPDPPALFPPQVVLSAGGAVAALGVLSGLVGWTVAAGLLAAALAGGPALAYHARFARTPLSERSVGGGGGLFVALAATVGLLTGAAVAGGAASALGGAATVDYCRERRYLTRRTRRLGAMAALVGGATVLVAGVVVDRTMTGIAVGMALVVVGAALAIE